MVSTDQVILQEPTLRREDSGQTMNSKETEVTTRSGTQATTQLSKRSEQERATMVMTSQSAWKRTGTKTRLGETSLTTHLRELTVHLTIMVLKGIGKIPPTTQSLDELTTLTTDKTETGQTTPTKINGRDKVSPEKLLLSCYLIVVFIIRKQWTRWKAMEQRKRVLFRKLRTV